MWHCSWSHSALYSQQRHGDKIFNCSNFSSWQAFKCERMNTNTLKYTSAGPGWAAGGGGGGAGSWGYLASPKWSVLILCCLYTRQPGLSPPKFNLFCILACFSFLGSGQGSWNISLGLPQPRWPHLGLEIINSLFKSNLHGLGPPR